MLPRVDFYLLKSNQSQVRWLVACRLLEKAYAKGHKVFVLCANQRDAEFIDELLWTFKEDSFIPHNLQGEGPEPPPPIQIGYGHQAPLEFSDILFNLSNQVPSFSIQFQRIIELVPNIDAEKEKSRTHYRHYREQGCDLHTHQIQ